MDSDQATSIIAILGLAGALQGYAAYSAYITFVEQFDLGNYFESGSFLGKGIIDAASVLYLLILAIQIG